MILHEKTAFGPTKLMIHMGNAGLFVAAAGNGGTNNDEIPIYPANYDVPNVISVMASTEDGRKYSDSNFGRRTVDIAAPRVSRIQLKV